MEEKGSPTAHDDSTLLTLIVGAHENRSVSVTCVKGACLNAGFGEFVLMKFENEQAGITCDTDEKHVKHVATEDGKRTMHHADAHRVICFGVRCHHHA